MNNKKVLSKFKVIFIIGIIVAMISGCSFIEKKSPQKIPSSDISVQPEVKKEAEKDLTESLKKEIYVSNGEVNIFDNMVFAVIIMKDDAKGENIDEIVNRYTTRIKEKYPNKKIAVQVYQNGKVMKNINQ